MKISFIGSGAWATALASTLAEKGFSPILYGLSKEEIDDININHRNSKYFPDIELNPSIKGTLDPQEAIVDADVIVLAVPSKAVPSILGLFPENPAKPPLIINVIKGFDLDTGEGVTTKLTRLFASKARAIVSLLGPTFAYCVIHKDPTACCAVSENIEAAREVQHLFSSSIFRVYVQRDLLGAEIGAGMKNAIAIASGIMSGLGYGDNARAALLTRGLAEITRYGIAKGAKAETFLGLTGIGDLTLTCSSPLSRNFSFGIEIGKANDAQTVILNSTKTVEGIRAAKSVHFDSARIGVETPIIDAVYRVLYENKKPSDEVANLMGRALKDE